MTKFPPEKTTFLFPRDAWKPPFCVGLLSEWKEREGRPALPIEPHGRGYMRTPIGDRSTGEPITIELQNMGVTRSERCWQVSGLLVYDGLERPVVVFPLEQPIFVASGDSISFSWPLAY